MADVCSESSSEGDGEEEDTSSLRVKRRRTTATPVVDRIMLKRQGSLGMVSREVKMAFAAGEGGQIGGFKVPGLLRRATANSTGSNESIVSGGSVSSTREGVKGVRMGGGKKCSINYHVREESRRAVVEEGERRRVEMWRGRGGAAGEGVRKLFGAGEWS
jgi:mediator of replication checkpoint protein 1